MRLARLWLLAALVGALGAAILFESRPGLNFLIWTAAAVTGLVLASRQHRHLLANRTLSLPLEAALLLSGGAVVADAPFVHVGIVVLVASLLALATLLIAQQPSTHQYGAIYILTAPVRALGRTIIGTIRTLVSTLGGLSGARLHPIVRGSMIAVPLALIFVLLFATADPVFAYGRDAVINAFSSWELRPRVVFGVLLTLFVLGAYGVAASGGTAALPRESERTTVSLHTIGVTERLVVLCTVATVFWLFVLLQVSYMFTAAPALAGSGMTFAEYARRGFGELAVAATTAVLLIVAARSAREGDAEVLSRAVSLRAASLLLIAAVICVLASALHRVSLYESAYGFTTRRVYAQAYMAMTFVILVVVAWHVLRRFDSARLARQIMTVSLATFAILVYWNDDAWVASRNLDRFERTGKIDIAYLTHGLAVDAYPALTDAIPALPTPVALQLTSALLDAGSRELDGPDRWFEWNLCRARARNVIFALQQHPSQSPGSRVQN